MIRVNLEKLALCGLIGILGISATAQTVNLNRSWIDGTRDSTRYYVRRVGASSYNASFVDVSGATEFEADILKGHEVNAWSFGSYATLAASGADASKGHFATIVSNHYSTITYTPDKGSWGDCLAVHQDWLKYTIAFDKNGGMGTMSGLTDCIYNVTKTLPSCEFTRTGYTFQGWARSASATTADYRAGDSVTGQTFGMAYDKKSVTLYAVWKANEYAVTFDANGGAFAGGVATQEITETYNEPYQLPIAPTRGGYTFANAWTNAAGREVISGTVLNIDANHTLYAKWNALPSMRIDVIKKADETGANGTVEGSGSYSWGQNCYLQATPSTGSRFAGWTKDAETGTYVSTDENHTVVVTAAATYYGHFALEEYTVTFKYKDASGGDAESTEVVKYGQSAHPPEAAKTGYTDFAFARWDQNYASIRDNITINAVYESTVLMVSFNANGGQVSEGTRKYNLGNTYGALPVPTRTGYAYGDCWWTQPTYGQPVYATTEVTTTGEQVLYAHWTPNEYTVTFDADGGTTPSPATKTVTYDRSYGTLATTTRTGYVFDGWHTPDTAKVESGTTVTIAEDHTLTAKWTAKTFWVDLDARGGTVGSNSIQVTYDQKYPELPAANYDGYLFQGWFTATEGGTQVKAGDRVQLSGNQRLYAQWKPEEHKVVFNANGGTASETSRIVAYNAEYGTLPAATRKGYTFDGWFNASDARISASTSFRERQDQTLTAKWTPIRYSISFERNGATSGYMSNQSFDYDEAKPLTANTYVRTGYTFLGWARSAAATEAEFGDKATVSNLLESSGTFTLYAVWQANTYTIAFANGGGSGTMAPVSATYDEDVTLPACTMTWGSNTFKGWLMNSVKYADGATVRNLTAEANATVTLVAQWSDDYAIEFLGNEATSGEMARQSIAVSEYAYLSPNAYVKTGYTFGGWATNETTAAEKKPSYGDGERVKGLGKSGSTVNLWAVWSNNTYTVRFFPNGGEGAPRDQKMMYDMTVTLTDVPFVRENHAFKGWVLDPMTETIAYTNRATVTNLTTLAKEVVALYAKWERIDKVDSELSESADCDTTVAGDHMSLLLTPVRYASVQKGIDDFGGNGMCARLDSANEFAKFSAVLKGAGKLTFRYKTYFQYPEAQLTRLKFVKAGLVVTDAICDTWRLCEYEKVSTAEETVEWTLEADYPTEVPGYAYIDAIKWLPDESDASTVGVTFRANDGTVAPADIVSNATYAVGKPYGTLPTLARDGREFLGWADSPSATAATVLATTSVPAKDVQLYAVWKTSANPVPTEEDRPVIDADFTFMTDARFDYVIWTTESLESPIDWTEGEPMKGDGKAFTLPVREDADLDWSEAEIAEGRTVPQRFYKVEVRQRK